MIADNTRRNDKVLKLQIRDNLRLKAKDSEKLRRLVEEMELVMRNNFWSDTKITLHLSGIKHELDFNSPERLREMATNDTYLGNAAAFGQDV
jgi:hypothetical protein